MPGGIPICVYEFELGLFRVLNNKGKSFSSGGFGIVCSSAAAQGIPTGSTQKSSIQNEELENDKKNDNNKETAPDDNLLYLFIEEAMFLHERGLIEVLKKEEDISKFESAELFHLMLHELHVPIQVYLTYAHLRSQTFIVNRHSSHRLSLIKRVLEAKSYKNRKNRPDNEKNFHTVDDSKPNIENHNRSPLKKESKATVSSNEQSIVIQNKDLNKSSSTQDDVYLCNNPKEKKEELKRKRKNRKESEQALKEEIRRDYIQAPIPTVYNGYEDDDIQIAFDVYQPNSSFSKMNPGIPDFYVSIANFGDPSPPFLSLKKLIHNCDNITLRMATVADGGSVIMFGVTDFGVPIISSDKLISDNK